MRRRSRSAHRRPRPVSAPLMAVALAATILLAACGIAAPGEASASAPAPSPSQVVSGAIELTRAAVESALRSQDLGLIVPQTPFRPPESTALLDVPRGVYQVILADDPTGGYLAIYEFPDPATAHAAGVAQAAWLASGPGSVYFPPGTTHVIRQVGNTLVTFSYPPSDAPDARAPKAAAALASVGLPISVGP